MEVKKKNACDVLGKSFGSIFAFSFQLKFYKPTLYFKMFLGRVAREM